PGLPGLGHTDLNSGGGALVNVPARIVMGSICNGTNCSGGYAGNLQGGNTVTAPFTYVAETTDLSVKGSVHLSNNSTWSATYQNQPENLNFFNDPESGKGQPPMNSTQASKPYIAVPG